MENKNNKNNNNKYIILYADDFDVDVWKEYCEILGVSNDSLELTIKVDSVSAIS